MYSIYGWICPKCGRVWAPWIPSCSCTDPTTKIGEIQPSQPYLPWPQQPYDPPPYNIPGTGDPLPPPTYITCDDVTNVAHKLVACNPEYVPSEMEKGE